MKNRPTKKQLNTQKQDSFPKYHSKHSKSPIIQEEEYHNMNQDYNLLNLNRNNINQFLNQQNQVNQQQPQFIKKKDNKIPLDSNNLTGSSSTEFGNISQIRGSGDIRSNHATLLSPGSISLQSSEAASKKESVQVYVRVRPPFEHEIDHNTSSNQYDHQQSQWSCIQATPPCWITLHNNQDVPKDFQFSQIFADQSPQTEVFQESALPLVFHVLNGYHGCYFVYGQTGTGKTYSMGVLNQIDEESQGIIPSSLDFIFKFFEEQEKNQLVLDWTVHISFFQIYQEQIQDLFNPLNKNMTVREELGEIFVEDLVEVPVKNLEQAMTIINAGLEHRQMASQNMNLTSSRSHTILNVDVFQTKQLSYNKTEQVSGRLTLVDLAGSERVRHTTSSGARLEEAKHINASLSALGNVISSLANQKKPFIPYRSSKLTRVLQNSLSGSSKIVVLATLGPGMRNYQESLSTLQFAQRCKEIILTPLIHTTHTQDDEEVSELKEKIMEIQFDFERRENELQKIIQSLQSKNQVSEERMIDMRNQNQILKQQLEERSSIKQDKVQQLSDLSIFMIKLTQKLADVNEVYDYSQKINQLNENDPSIVVQELESEFPFNIKQRSVITQSESIDLDQNYDLLGEQDLTLSQIAQRLSLLAKKNIDNINLLGSASKTQILLKQYTREQIEDNHMKIEQSKQNQSENLKILLKELIDVKKMHIKDAFKLQLLDKKEPVTHIEKIQLKESIVQVLRTYIADEILPMLNIEELTEDQEEDIDQEILNLSFTLNTLETELQTFDQQIKQTQNDSFNNNSTPVVSTNVNVFQSNLPYKEQKRDSQDNWIKLAENNFEEQNFEDTQKSSLQLSKKSPKQNIVNKNQSLFKKQKIFSNSSNSSDQDVIIEEEKESDYTLQTEERQKSSEKLQSYVQNQNLSQSRNPILSDANSSMSNTQKLKKLNKSQDQNPQNQVMRADKLIILSKGFTERCFLKFLSHFVGDKSDHVSLGACGPTVNTKKVANLSSRDIPKDEYVNFLPQNPKYVQKKTKTLSMSSNKIKVDTSPLQNKQYEDEDEDMVYKESSRQKVNMKRYVNDSDDNDQHMFEKRQKHAEKTQHQGPTNPDKRFTFNQHQIQVPDEAKSRKHSKDQRTFYIRNGSQKSSSQMSRSKESEDMDY